MEILALLVVLALMVPLLVLAAPLIAIALPLAATVLSISYWRDRHHTAAHRHP